MHPRFNISLYDRMEKLTFEQFLEAIQGSDRTKQEDIYYHYVHGYKERERQRDKSRRQYENRKKKNQPPQ